MTGTPRARSEVLANERVRRRYRPAHVRLLFVGESPPASGRFFYQANSGLYRAIREAFVTTAPALQRTDFLESFRDLGCYLIDLCARPVDRLGREERMQACRDGEVRLSRTIRQLQPNAMITVVRSITANVTRAQTRAGWSGVHLEVPYPGRWHHHRIAFLEALTPVLLPILGKSSGKMTAGA